MKALILLMTLLVFQVPAVAGLYVGLSGGESKVLGDDDGIKDKITGESFGIQAGYRLPILGLAPEIGFKSTSSDGTVTFNGGTTQTDVEMDLKFTTLGARFFFLHFFHIAGGVVSAAMDTVARQNGVEVVFPLDGSEEGIYWSLGGHFEIPLTGVDLFAEINIYDIDVTAVQTVDLGVRYFF